MFNFSTATELAAFQTVCTQMLMDVQERLVYRTYIYIKADILNYKGATGDLAYPEKLEMMEVGDNSFLLNYNKDFSRFNFSYK